MPTAIQPIAMPMHLAVPLLLQVPAPPSAPPSPQTATPAIADANVQIASLATELANLELQRVGTLADIRSNDAAVRATARGQLRELDAQIAQTKASIKDMSATLARSQQPVIITPTTPPWLIHDGPGVFPMLLVVMAFVIVMPIVIGIGRRIGRRGASVSSMPDTVSPRLDRMEQAIDAIAIEVERVSESQRFIAKLLSDRGVAQVPAEAGAGGGVIDASRVRGVGRG